MPKIREWNSKFFLIKFKQLLTLSKIYVIGILDFSFDNSYPDSVITKVQLMDNRGDVFNDVLNFVYIELPKFRKNKENSFNLTIPWKVH